MISKTVRTHSGIREGNAPQFCLRGKKGATIRNVVQMASAESTRNDIKPSRGRQTPFDVRVAGTFAEKPKHEKEEPRKATPEEVRANNRAKVEFGLAMFDLRRWIPIFKSDLTEMNRCKVGAPYKFSDSMIAWILQFMASTDADFRLTSGLFLGIMPLFGVDSPSYSRLNERCTELVGKMMDTVASAPKERYDDHILAFHVCGNVSERIRRVGLDSSGINLSNTNLWRKTKWNTSPKYRGWLEIHALCDVDSGEIIAYAVTDDSVGDAPMLEHLVEAALERGHRFDTLYADGAYCSDNNWKIVCGKHKLRFITSFRSNTRPRCNGCFARGEAARLWCSLPYDEWVKVSGYGTRWKCECVFSDFKRLFPETVTAKSRNGIIRQLSSRVNAFNDYKIIRSAIMRVTGNGILIG